MAASEREEMRKTIADVRDEIAPGWAWEDLVRWPPDVFAITSTTLAESGAYRLVVSPPPNEAWPPDPPPQLQSDATSGLSWPELVNQWAQEWADYAVYPRGEGREAMPASVATFIDILSQNEGVALADLGEPDRWQLLTAIVSLHAMADEACAGVGVVAERETALHLLATTFLTDRGSLSRLPQDRVRILPKLRVPESGITIRSLSRNLALVRSEVGAGWHLARPRAGIAEVVKGGTTQRFNMLLVPWPMTIQPSDFRPVLGPLTMDPKRFGFFEFHSHVPLRPEWVAALVRQATKQVGKIDAVILPEVALSGEEAEKLHEALEKEDVPYLVAGVRKPGTPARFGSNYAYLVAMRRTGERRVFPQCKHHRWCLDGEQVRQYHLGAALDPAMRWWEAVDIDRRHLTFFAIGDWGLTICPLICEDLARPDPVADVIRAVGPTLVIAILLDGPQLKSRWTARYAAVLADDPGCSVVTLTALGMAQRCQPSGFPRSRSVALWKDPRRGLHEIELGPDGHAVVLTACLERRTGVTADTRPDDEQTTELTLAGIEEIRLAEDVAGIEEIQPAEDVT